MKILTRKEVIFYIIATLIMIFVSFSIANASEASQIQQLCQFEADGEFPFNYFCE